MVTNPWKFFRPVSLSSGGILEILCTHLSSLWKAFLIPAYAWYTRTTFSCLFSWSCLQVSEVLIVNFYMLGRLLQCGVAQKFTIMYLSRTTFSWLFSRSCLQLSKVHIVNFYMHGRLLQCGAVQKFTIMYLAGSIHKWMDGCMHMHTHSVITWIKGLFMFSRSLAMLSHHWCSYKLDKNFLKNLILIW